MAVTIGGIAERLVLHNGDLETREVLCLTVSFDHDIVDGAPAARFMKRFADLLTRGDLLGDEVLGAGQEWGR